MPRDRVQLASSDTSRANPVLNNGGLFSLHGHEPLSLHLFAGTGPRLIVMLWPEPLLVPLTLVPMPLNVPLSTTTP